MPWWAWLLLTVVGGPIAVWLWAVLWAVFYA